MKSRVGEILKTGSSLDEPRRHTRCRTRCGNVEELMHAACPRRGERWRRLLGAWHYCAAPLLLLGVFLASRSASAQPPAGGVAWAPVIANGELVEGWLDSEWLATLVFVPFAAADAGSGRCDAAFLDDFGFVSFTSTVPVAGVVLVRVVWQQACPQAFCLAPHT